MLSYDVDLDFLKPLPDNVESTIELTPAGEDQLNELLN